MAWVGRDLQEHLVPANIASISGSPPGAVPTRPLLSLYHKAAKSSSTWAHWCDSAKEGRRKDVLMQYWRSVFRAHQGIQVLQGFMLDWHIVPAFLWGKRLVLASENGSLTHSTYSSSFHTSYTQACSNNPVLSGLALSKTQCIMVCSFPFCLRVKLSSPQ